MRFLNKKGQSLIELIVAIAVIEIGIFSVWSLFLVNFNAEREAEMRIVGVNLAREGVEVIKNIRDSNWLKNTNNQLDDDKNIWPWDRYLAAGTYAINFNSDFPEIINNGNDLLYLSSFDGFYTNSSDGNKLTPYRRAVTLNDICCDDGDDNLKCDNSEFTAIVSSESCPAGMLKIGVNIISNVTWQISGQPRRVIVEDKIYNWK